LNLQTILQLLTALTANLAINAIPAGLVLIGGSSAATAMVLYFLENLVSVLLAAARVRILAPANDDAYADMGYDDVETSIDGQIRSQRKILRTRRVLIIDYVSMAFFFSAATGIFLSAFLFLILRMDISPSAILTGMGGILALQLLSFIADLVLLGPLTPAHAEILLKQSLGRVSLIYFAVFIGAILAAIVGSNWFVLPFAGLKTTADLAATIQSFRVHRQVAGSESVGP
jgi:hypothetical protein